MALVATVSGASSNSYVTLAEAETYFGDRLGASDNGNWNKDSAGTSRTDATKSAALVTATRRIDEEQFLGVKVSTTQALKWPRYDVNDEDGIPFYDSSSPAIPERVKQATYLCALELLKTNFLDEDYLHNFEYFSTGTLQFKQFTQQSSGRLPSEVTRLLRTTMVSGTGVGRLTRA